MTPDPDHKLLDLAQHLSGYILGVIAVTAAAIRFWWNDRVLTRNKIDENMEKVMFEVRKIREQDQIEHAEIRQDMNDKQVELINKMLSLHKKD